MTPTTKKRAAAVASDTIRGEKKGEKTPSAAERAARVKKPLRRSPDEEMITQDVLEFIAAVDDYKKRNNRPFPTWSEVLKVITDLGYRRVEPRKSQGVA